MGVGALSPRQVAARVKELVGARFMGQRWDREVAMLEEVSGWVGGCERVGRVGWGERKKPTGRGMTQKKKEADDHSIHPNPNTHT